MGDTIAACATPWGTGAISVVRVSGAGSAEVVRRVGGRIPAERRAGLVRLRDDDGVFDEGVRVWMPGPRSYTGEDLAEISCHGNPLLVERLLAALCTAGARLAAPGEYTRRAWLNGRMDLVRAEAVLQTIEATSPRGLEVSREGLDGRLGSGLEALRVRLVDVAAELEAILDYPGEDLLFRGDMELAYELSAVLRDVERLLASYRIGRLAVEGARVALVGPVNAGKSTLLNALLGRQRAIVSPAAGTTRDVIEATLVHPEARLTLIDTAGERDTVDPVELAGLTLGREAAAGADLRVFVAPLHVPFPAEWEDLLAALPAPVLRVGTHADLPPCSTFVPDVAVAAPRGDGLEALVQALVARLGGVGDPLAATGTTLGGVHVASPRQADLLRTVARELAEAVAAFPAGPAVVVEALYRAVGAIDAVFGRDTREDVLDRLFARFCIGK